MNTKGLSNLYDRLTIRERIPLVMAAEARKDDTEQRRLQDSAPIRTMRFPDYFWPTMGLNTLALLYLVEQLDALANYWHALCRLADPNADPKVWTWVADSTAFFFSRNVEAWQDFCAEQGIDPALLTNGNYRGWLLHYCAEKIPETAPTDEEMAAMLAERGRKDGKPVTAESLRKSWSDLFHKMNERPKR